MWRVLGDDLGFADVFDRQCSSGQRVAHHPGRFPQLAHQRGLRQSQRSRDREFQALSGLCDHYFGRLHDSRHGIPFRETREVFMTV